MVMAIIKMQALLTIRRQRWLTRQVAVENGQVVRTSGADPAPIPATAAASAAASAVASAGATQGVRVPVGGRTDLVSAGMSLRLHMPGMPAGDLVPRQASPTEQFSPVRADPGPT